MTAIAINNKPIVPRINIELLKNKADEQEASRKRMNSLNLMYPDKKLGTPTQPQIFSAYTKKIFCHENLEAIRQIKIFEAKPNLIDKLLFSKVFYNAYIRSSAPHQINISFMVQVKLMHKTKKIINLLSEMSLITIINSQLESSNSLPDLFQESIAGNLNITHFPEAITIIIYFLEEEKIITIFKNNNNDNILLKNKTVEIVQTEINGLFDDIKAEIKDLLRTDTIPKFRAEQT